MADQRIKTGQPAQAFGVKFAAGYLGGDHEPLPEPAIAGTHTIDLRDRLFLADRSQPSSPPLLLADGPFPRFRVPSARGAVAVPVENEWSCSVRSLRTSHAERQVAEKSTVLWPLSA